MTRQTALAALVGLALAALGGYGTYVMLTTPTWPTLLLPLVALFGVAILALAGWAQTFGRRSRIRLLRGLADHVGTFTVLFVAGTVLVFALVTGVERHESYAMTWEVARGADQRRYGPALLRPVGFDNTWIAVESEDAIHRLEAIGHDALCVEIRMRYDFGRLNGWSVQRIGGLEQEPLRLGASNAGDPRWPPRRPWGGPSSTCEMP